MHANLSLQQSPPFSVPARFLISAPLFSVVAAVIMLWYGPEMIEHRWTPELLAVTHFLTLGFLAMSMLGALMQLMPVLMGIVIPHAVFFSRLIHLPLMLGTACLGLAWLSNIKSLFLTAMILLGFAFSIFIIIAIERLSRSINRHVTRSMMLLALIALSVTITLGIYLVMGYTWSDYPVARH
ncbi:MAG: hypothetical protein OEZ15_11495, partial [Gammaproteobacteria bacterium]|nr:hypothetical protein [Gammaproteobacteria bacterium]